MDGRMAGRKLQEIDVTWRVIKRNANCILLWVELCPPRRHIEALALKYLKIWSHLEIGTLQVWLIKLKWGHIGIEKVFNLIWLVFYKRESWTLTETQRKDHPGKMGARLEWCCQKPKQETLERMWPSYIIIWDCQPSELWENMFPLCKAPQFVRTFLAALGNNTHF